MAMAIKWPAQQIPRNQALVNVHRHCLAVMAVLHCSTVLNTKISIWIWAHSTNEIMMGNEAIASWEKEAGNFLLQSWLGQGHQLYWKKEKKSPERPTIERESEIGKLGAFKFNFKCTKCVFVLLVLYLTVSVGRSVWAPVSEPWEHYFDAISNWMRVERMRKQWDTVLMITLFY